jgi:hypothetical protein
VTRPRAADNFPAIRAGWRNCVASELEYRRMEGQDRRSGRGPTHLIRATGDCRRKQHTSFAGSSEQPNGRVPLLRDNSVCHVLDGPLI